MSRNRNRWNRSRRGNAIVEFIVIAFVLYMMLAGVLSFGHLLYASQASSQAADAAAREMSRTPLPATWTFEEARDNPASEFRTSIYSDDYLAMDVSIWAAGGTGLTLLEWVDANINPPFVNRSLIPLMFIDVVGPQTLLRYPGALIVSGTAASGYTVEIPVVIGETGGGNEVVRWERVVEEIDTEDAPGDNTGPAPDPFPADSPQGGIVALRINYPYQSAVMSGFREGLGGPFAPNVGNPIYASDAGVVAVNAPSGAQVSPAAPVGPYAGSYGLGRQLAFGQSVRPFRKVLSSQAVYRREVFE